MNKYFIAQMLSICITDNTGVNGWNADTISTTCSKRQ